MRRCSVLTAGHLHHDHIAAVEGVQGPVMIDRRCADLAELVAAARAGWADAALLIGDTEMLTGTLLDELVEASLTVVVISDVAEERARLRALGVTALPDEVPADVLTEALQGCPIPDQEPDQAALDHGLPSPSGPAGEDWPERFPVAESRESPEKSPGQSSGSGESPAAPGDVEPVGVDPIDAELAELLDSSQAAPAAEEHGEDGGDGDDGSDGEVGADGDDDAGVASADADDAPDDGPPTSHLAGITTVWGAPGSPGRTTIAVNLAAELALTGARVLLVDADTIASSVATHLGLLEESAGLAQACRQADLGRLDSARLRRAAAVVDIGGLRLHLLTGLPRADRWPELRGPALRQVLQLAARDFDHVVVDVAAPTEQDEELTFDTRAPQRHAATVAAVEEAHTLLVVGAPDPVAFPRLIKAFEDLRANVPQAPAPQPLINQTRREAVGRAPEEQLREAWVRFGPEQPISAFLPWDRAACDEALLAGQVLAEASPQSELRRAVAELAGAPLPARRRRLLRR